ncbi:hypothetical protein J4455_02110 [Candidatus Woesearchaeota archaeon]|nr:hypothetical protein [Candidatus Woesearchaeota archaeon]
MAEVDTIFSIKRLYSLIEICRPFLAKKELDDSVKLASAIKKRNFILGPSGTGLSLVNILDNAFGESANPRKTGRMKKYLMHEDLLVRELSIDENLFRDKLPILINGLTATSLINGRKEGIDPFSNLHLFSTLFIEQINERFPIEFLDQFLLFYVQPVTYIQRILQQGGNFGLEHILRERIEREIDAEIDGIGFGTLAKFEDTSPKQGNSRFDPNMFSFERFRSALQSSPELLMPEDNHDRIFDFQRSLELKRYEIHCNNQIMALKFAWVLDQLFPFVVKTLRNYDLNGIPLYMEKTSDSARIVNDSAYYSGKPLRFHFVGGDHGIMANTPERMPFLGICHPTAMARLIGLFDNMYMTWSNQYSRRTVSLTRPKIQEIVRYDSSGKYPFLLVEENLGDKHPNLQDLADEILSEREISILRDFSYVHRIGFCRIEPRIVELLKTDASIYHGLRALDKSNRRWFVELDGKRIVTSDMISGFFNMRAIKEEKADFRGSELGLPTGGKVDTRSLERFQQSGVLDVGCTLEKLISGLSESVAKSLVREQIQYASSETLEELFRFADKTTLESSAQIRGTAIHRLSSSPLEGLVHYDTLTRAGLEPKPSNLYTETPFSWSLNIDGVSFSVSMHPDAYLFLKRDDSNYDIVIIDTKTNSVKPYIEHKYLQQTFFYGWLLKQIVESELNIEIHNIYTVLNKNAFYTKRVITIPHSIYRPQRFSPITLFDSDDPMHMIMPQLVCKIATEKEVLKEDPNYYIRYKSMQEEKGNCKKCYTEHRMICDRLAAKRTSGENIFHFFKDASSA